jgi:hypothetical protein
VRFLRHNSLSIVFLVIFLASLVGQAFVGHGLFNHDQLLHHGDPISLGRYITTSEFVVDVAENWQSEYLQFTLFILGTVWLLQHGSPESKELDKAGRESDKDQKVGRFADPDSPAWARTDDWRTRIFSSSLALVMGAIFLASWLVQSVAGWAAFNEERLQQLQDPLAWTAYLVNADFWARTLQNWQSEFLAVGTLAVLAIYLRQRGSSQSKPVGEAHDTTGVEG